MNRRNGYGTGPPALRPMVFNVRDTMVAIQGHLQSQGWVTSVIQGEPDNPPPHEGVHAAIFMDSTVITGVKLSGTIEQQNIVVRLYQAEAERPVERRESQLDGAYSYLEKRLLQDLDLGGTVRNVQPVQLESDWGYLDQAGTQFRIVEVVVPVVVDDSATQAA